MKTTGSSQLSSASRHPIWIVGRNSILVRVAGSLVETAFNVADKQLVDILLAEDFVDEQILEILPQARKVVPRLSMSVLILSAASQSS